VIDIGQTTDNALPEIACFGDERELVSKIRYYLVRDAEREKMRHAAHERCVTNYKVDGLADHIIRRYEEDIVARLGGSREA
jgi:spore maturation protein CgeB